MSDFQYDWHPAVYSKPILEHFDQIVDSRLFHGGDKLPIQVLDPFAGTGRIHTLARPGIMDTVGVEIQEQYVHPEMFGIEDWKPHPNTVHGDATAMAKAWTNYFHMVMTSPCLASFEKVLTADLRWVCAGDIEEGDKLIAFDEFPPGLTARDRAARRNYKIAEVTGAGTAMKQCVRVITDRGNEVICSFDHPWLARPLSGRAQVWGWTAAENLIGMGVAHQFDHWTDAATRDDGWLAGMFDGEGSVYFGAHGAPKLQIAQNPGPLLDGVLENLKRLGFTAGVYEKGSGCISVIVNGGIPDIARLLGSVRPERLLTKFADAESLARRKIQPTIERVVAVEAVGRREIATLTTSSGTYIGAGFLMHNTYGNRFSDRHQAKDASKRRGYTHDLRRMTGDPELELHPNNTGRYAFHTKQYQELHQKAWREVWRVLRPGGWFVLNVSDVIKSGEAVEVAQWHHDLVTDIGFDTIKTIPVETRRLRYGRNGAARAAYEMIYVLEKRAA